MPRPCKQLKPFWLVVWRPLLGVLMLGVSIIIASVVSSCSTDFQHAAFFPPQIEGAYFVGNEICADCHTNFTRAFASSPHSRLQLPEKTVVGGVGCESCHGPGSLHVKNGGGRGVYIINPRHDPVACFNCHTETHAEFKLPQHHPVLEERMNCVQCHDPHGMDILKPKSGLAMARLNESCAQCHREQTKLAIFEHEALREGCTTCHQPHGSINDKMLVQRDNNLCLKCHAQVHTAGGQIYIGETPHTDLLKRGSCWSSGCHTAVHGSNIDRRLRY